MNADRIVVQNVTKRFRIGVKRDRSSALGRLLSSFAVREPRRDLWALNDISCTFKAGEFVGIVGRNGSGKTTLLQIITGTMFPTSGTVQTYGTVVSLINLRVGLQDRLTVMQNIDLCCALFGLSPKQVKGRRE